MATTISATAIGQRGCTSPLPGWAGFLIPIHIERRGDMLPNMHTTMTLRGRVLDPNSPEQGIKMSTHCQILGLSQDGEKWPTLSFLEPVDAIDEPEERLIQCYRTGELILPDCNRRFLGTTTAMGSDLCHWFEVLG